MYGCLSMIEPCIFAFRNSTRLLSFSSRKTNSRSVQSANHCLTQGFFTRVDCWGRILGVGNENPTARTTIENSDKMLRDIRNSDRLF